MYTYPYFVLLGDLVTLRTFGIKLNEELFQKVTSTARVLLSHYLNTRQKIKTNETGFISVSSIVLPGSRENLWF